MGRQSPAAFATIPANAEGNGVAICRFLAIEDNLPSVSQPQTPLDTAGQLLRYGANRLRVQAEQNFHGKNPRERFLNLLGTHVAHVKECPQHVICDNTGRPRFSRSVGLR